MMVLVLKTTSPPPLPKIPATSEAVTSIVERGQDEYALAVLTAGGDAARTVVHLKEAFAELGPTPDLPATDLAGLTKLEMGGTITATQAKSVLARMIQDGCGDAAALAAEMGFEAMDTGALEAIFTILAIQNRVAPPTINLTTQDPEIPLLVSGEAQPLGDGPQLAISNSFGFGGQNASLILTREPV